jgi:predicted MFS family arabinose efflux permease
MFVAFNMATSFLPVYIIRFVNDGIRLPTALANSLPITINLVFVAFTSLFCPKIMSQTGFTKIAVISGLIALSGDVMIALCNDYAMLVIGLSLNGLGVGLITNSIHILVATLSGDDKESKGFSIFNAAILSGINCGILLGSGIAGQLGQSNVFLVSAAVWAVVILIFIAVGKRFVASRPDEESLGSGTGRFVFSPEILKFMLLIQIPYIIMSSFVYYYVPIFGDERGYSESIVSILIIMCSMCSVYLSVPATKYLQMRFREKSMYISGAISFAGMLIFAWQMTLPAMIIALILIGVANSFGPATRTTHFIDLKRVQQYGKERAMGIFNFVDNIGDSTGSIIFASLLSAGFRGGILGLVACATGFQCGVCAVKRQKSA